MRRLSLLALFIVALAVPPVCSASSYSYTEFSVTTGAHPSGITVGHDGNIWFTENAGNRVGMIDLSSGSVTEYPIPSAGAQPTRIIAGQSFSGTRVLYFLEPGVNKIGVFDLGTSTITEKVVPTAAAGLVDLVQGPDGSVWFTEAAASKVGRLTVSGTFTEFPTPTASSGASWITVGKTGTLFVTEYNIGKIAVVTTAGGITEIAASATNPTGAGVTSYNTMYTVDAATNALMRRCMDTFCLGGFTTLVSYSSTPGIGPLVVAPDNSVWLVNNIYDIVARAYDSPGGATTTTVGLVANSSPTDLVVGPDGNIWVTESGRDKIARINLHSLPGDANDDGQLTIADVFYLINYLFQGGPLP